MPLSSDSLSSDSLSSDPGALGTAAATPDDLPPVLPPHRLTTPALGALLRHWQAAAAEAGGLPGRAAFGFESLRPWLGRLAIFAPVPGGDWQVRLDGTDIVLETGIDWTGLTARTIERRYRVDLVGPLDACARGGVPLAQKLTVYNEDHRTAERLLLPVRAGDGAVQVFLALYPVRAG